MGRSAIFGERKVRVARPANMLTQKQSDILCFLWSFYEENDQLPPCDAIAAHFKYASANAAYTYLTILARKGWIERNVLGKWRFTPMTREALQPLPVKQMREEKP